MRGGQGEAGRAIYDFRIGFLGFLGFLGNKKKEIKNARV
jgi:hypothetical protein